MACNGVIGINCPIQPQFPSFPYKNIWYPRWIQKATNKPTVNGIINFLKKWFCKKQRPKNNSHAMIALASAGAKHQLVIFKSTNCFSNASIGNSLDMAENTNRKAIIPLKIQTIVGFNFVLNVYYLYKNSNN